MFDLKDLSARWSRVCEVMERLDLDVIIAIDSSRDEILLSTQRWLTGFTPLGGPAAALVFRDGHVELCSRWLGRTAPAFYAKSGLPIETVAEFSPTLFAERLSRVRAKRVGFAEDGSFPASVYMALAAMSSPPEVVDIAEDIIRLRLQKSDAELEAVRKSCAIADKVWSNVTDIFRPGRKYYEILADVEHLAKLEGAENGFYLLGKLPLLGLSMRVLADPEEILGNSRYMLEVSPRYDGYYSQLTSLIINADEDQVAVQAYSDVVAAKEFALPRMISGADLSEIAKDVEIFLRERGHVMASRSLGHFCGMALEEPRHDPSKPFILQNGMTFIFHPVLFSPELASLMRADTYLITSNGAERMNKFSTDVVRIK